MHASTSPQSAAQLTHGLLCFTGVVFRMLLWSYGLEDKRGPPSLSRIPLWAIPQAASACCTARRRQTVDFFKRVYGRYHSPKSSHLVVIGIVRDRDARLVLHGARHHEAPRGSHPYNYCREQRRFGGDRRRKASGQTLDLYTLFFVARG